MILGKKDKLGMKAFVKALFLLLKDKEGIVVEVDKKLYVVHKGRHEDGEMLLQLGDLDDFNVDEIDRRESVMLWINKEKE